MTKVLVVDDERDGADALAMFFEALGHHTATAYNGSEAVEAWRIFQPDFVVLDIEMPLMDGFQVARLLRDHSDGTRPVLVALTGLAGNDVETRTKACGFDHYMAKPADFERLKELVERSHPEPRPT
jgi:CheY-like chemotaxis protein